MNPLLLILGHIWALPMNLAGAMTCFGAKPVRSIGPAWTLVGGPLWQWFFKRYRVRAITLGGWIFCRTELDAFDQTTEIHEERHVFQQMILGPLFPLLYYGQMPILWAMGKSPYFDNWFEKDARRAAGEA